MMSAKMGKRTPEPMRLERDDGDPWPFREARRPTVAAELSSEKEHRNPWHVE
jgi:hypothetical protein